MIVLPSVLKLRLSSSLGRYAVILNEWYKFSGSVSGCRQMLRPLSTSGPCYKKKAEQKNEEEISLTISGFFSHKEQTKEAFLVTIQAFKIEKRLTRHVEFIYAALKNMKEFGVHKDLEVYKELIDVMPKGKMIPQNIFQSEFYHYPQHQFCAIDLLEQMEHYGVIPDTEMEQILLNIFGKHGYPLRKFGRMMYWMVRFKYASPWPLPQHLTSDALILAKMAVERMCTVDPTSEITVYQTKDVPDAVDHTWIVSGQSPEQQMLLDQHPKDMPLKVEGPFAIYLRDRCVGYFILRSEQTPNICEQETDDVSLLGGLFLEEKENAMALGPRISVHQQEDGTILAICCTGTSSRDSLLSWIRILEKTCPRLGEIPVLFTQTSPIGTIMTIETKEDSRQPSSTHDS